MVEAAVPRRSEGHSLRRCWSRLEVLASRRPAPFLTSRDGELWQLQLPTRRLLPQLLLPGLQEKHPIFYEVDRPLLFVLTLFNVNYIKLQASVSQFR